jgi:uncharacterized membrane protein YhhN
MNLGRLARGRRVLAGYWGATVVQVAAVAFDVKILKQASKATLMPLLWQWSRTQDAPPLPMAAYALLLTATAVASRWHNSRSGVGGALFLVSDALIALRMSGRDFPGRGALTMSTYAVGQYLLTSGVTKSDR